MNSSEPCFPRMLPAVAWSLYWKGKELDEDEKYSEVI